MALLLVRHGATYHDLGPHPQLDFDDTSLSAAGYRRVTQLATGLAPFRVPVILSTDLRRGIETARPWATMSGSLISLQPALRPWDRRGLIGLGEEEIGSMLEANVRDPQRPLPGGGESFAQYCDRFIPFALAFLCAPELVGMVTHSTGVRIIAALIAKGMPLDPEVYLATPVMDPATAAIATLTGFRPVPV